MKELLWKRAQLLQFERAKAAREKTSLANGSNGKTKPRGPPPKLGKPKSALEKGTQGQANGTKPKASQVCYTLSLQRSIGNHFRLQVYPPKFPVKVKLS